MRECRHFMDPDACELCQEHMRQVAANRGPGRPLSMSQERRDEIARIAEKRKWSDVVWGGISVIDVKKERAEAVKRENARQGIIVARRQRWENADTKSNRARALLLKNPMRSTNEIARAVGLDAGRISALRTEMGLPPLRMPKEVYEVTQDRVDADPIFADLVKRVFLQADRGYRSGRIAQLLDVPQEHVKEILRHRDKITFKRAAPERIMTATDVKAAYQLWREGHTYRAIAERLGLRPSQISQRLRPFLVAQGER